MKETKVGKKPHGVVLVVSLGKPGDKKPERAADPDKREKMDRLSSEMSRRSGRPLPNWAAQLGAGRQVANQVRYQQGNLNDSNAEPKEKSPGLADDVASGHSGRRGSKAQAEDFQSGVPLMQRLQEQEDAKKPKTEEEDLYANIFADQDMTRRAFDNLEALDALQKGEPVDFCTCCSPSDIAWAIAKAKKKSKPFHGYNPRRHHKKGGLNAAGRAKFKRETGANLKPPVTTKPSKLKPGSKKAKRRKSFCARMGGMKGPTSKKGKLTPKGAALKRWNC